MLALVTAAYAEPDLPKGFALGLSGSVGGSSSGFQTGGAVRLRLGGGVAVEPWVDVSSVAGTNRVEDNPSQTTAEPTVVANPSMEFGGALRFRLAHVKEWELALLVGGAWGKETSTYTRTQDEYTSVSVYERTDASVLAGVGLERAVLPWLSVGADAHSALYQWSLDEDTTTYTYVDPDTDPREEVEVERLSGPMFRPAVRLVVTMYL